MLSEPCPPLAAVPSSDVPAGLEGVKGNIGMDEVVDHLISDSTQNKGIKINNCQLTKRLEPLDESRAEVETSTPRPEALQPQAPADLSLIKPPEQQQQQQQQQQQKQPA